MTSRALRLRRKVAGSRGAGPTGAAPLPRASFRSPAVRLTGLPGATALERAETSWLQRRLPFRLDDLEGADGSEGWSVERSGPWLELARVREGCTGRQAAAHNLDIVTGICDELAIRYVAVPGPDTMAFRLMIDSARWADFVTGLRRAGEREPLYVVLDTKNRLGRPERTADLTVRPRIASALDTQSSIEVYQPMTPDHGVATFGREWACAAERWSPDKHGRLRAPTRNDRAEYVPAPTTGRLERIDTVDAVAGGRTLPTLEFFARPHIFDVDFPVDVVYLWVNGDDPRWRERKKLALEAAGGTWTEPDAVTDARFREGGELRYSLRSLEMFAPWVRHVYLVTDDQVPDWLDASHPGLTVVDHRELFGQAGALPTFNSHAIGARLHHIDGLSEHYVYFNDDVFLGRDVMPSLFFEANGTSRFFLSRTSLGYSDESNRMSHESARRNVADLIARDFGRTPTNVFYHSPIPQRRSTMFELEQRYPHEFETTWNNQFRSHSDIEPNSWLHNYYGYLTGRAAPGRIRYSYFQIGDPQTNSGLRQLFAVRDRDTFCINDNPGASAEQHRYAADWLATYFPRPSTFETGPQ